MEESAGSPGQKHSGEKGVQDMDGECGSPFVCLLEAWNTLSPGYSVLNGD